MDNKFQVIFCIVNNGFSDNVMEAAKEKGATGGTVISGRGTAREEAEKLFQIPIHPEKEIVMIITPNKLVDGILSNIYNKVGLNTPGQGIAFTLPVSNVVGIGSNDKQEQKTNS